MTVSACHPKIELNPNLVAVLRTLVLLALIAAATFGGLSETITSLFLSRLP